MPRMGYEYRVHFEVNQLDPRTYAPDEFLAHLPDDVPRLTASTQGSRRAGTAFTSIGCVIPATGGPLW